MGTWNSRGLRGSTLEDMVNKTNEKYRDENIPALEKKLPYMSTKTFEELCKYSRILSELQGCFFFSKYLLTSDSVKGTRVFLTNSSSRSRMVSFI